ncbi:DUF1275 family protein [Cellulosimicrobium sp. 22601]|uniref:DUF1275 family protein n=1 Tax=unclassified Cellulosimicrobium TaxID=2624466 RepID=UPI003F860D3D
MQNRRPTARAPLSPVPQLLALTFSTGVIDAVGYLGLDRVFAGNMTGNVVILGMGLAGADLPVAGPSLALGAFVLGAALGGRVLRGSVTGWTPRTRALLLGVTTLLTLGAALALAGDLGTHETSAPSVLGMLVTAFLALAMGAQAAAARHVKVADVTTVVVTSTITGLAADSWLGHRVDQPWARRGAAVVLMILGALAGALLLQLHLVAGIAASAAITAIAALLGHTNRDGVAR